MQIRSSDFSRRAVVKACLAGAAASSLPARLQAATELPLITKPIPRTGEQLPVIGLGTIWYRDANYAELKPVLGRLFELGASVVDTAAAYGESEGVIGKALQELNVRQRCFLASKFISSPSAAAQMKAASPGSQSGPGPGGVDGPPPGISRPAPDGIGSAASFERSLQRLRTDHLDLLQVHNIADAQALLPMMLDWKKAGKIRYVGVSAPAGRPQQLTPILEAFPLDFVQLDYSMGNRAAENGALQACAAHGAAVLINLPLGRNSLLRKTQGHALPAWLQEIGVTSWAQFLLKWVVSHPAITCAIPGTSSVAHLEDDCRAGRGQLATPAQRLRMEQDWAALS